MKKIFLYTLLFYSHYLCAQHKDTILIRSPKEFHEIIIGKSTITEVFNQLGQWIYLDTTKTYKGNAYFLDAGCRPMYLIEKNYYYFDTTLSITTYDRSDTVKEISINYPLKVKIENNIVLGKTLFIDIKKLCNKNTPYSIRQDKNGYYYYLEYNKIRYGIFIKSKKVRKLKQHELENKITQIILS